MVRATEDQFLGALLGLAIGDALGRPLVGLDPTEIDKRFGKVDRYLPADDRDKDAPTGIITDETEVTLCIVESLTTNDGMIEPENINARLEFLLRGDSRRWMPESVIAGIQRAEKTDGLVPVGSDDGVELSVAARGVPIGLLHSLGAQDDETMLAEAGVISRFSHGGETQQWLTFAVARSVCAAATGQSDPLEPVRSRLGDSDAVRQFFRVVEESFASMAFEDGVIAVVNRGGPSDSTGALAGAISGARFGASGIPQILIDQLDARIYLSLAAPWFYRTALRRAGTVIDLREVR